MESTLSQPVSAMLGGKIGTVHSKHDHLLPLPRNSRQDTCETTLAREREDAGPGHPDVPPCNHLAPKRSLALCDFYFSLLSFQHPQPCEAIPTHGTTGSRQGSFLGRSTTGPINPHVSLVCWRIYSPPWLHIAHASVDAPARVGTRIPRGAAGIGGFGLIL